MVKTRKVPEAKYEKKCDTCSLKDLCMPGIGKKTAQRLIMEMRDRIGELNLGPGRILNADNELPSAAFNATDDAVSALVALGYKLPEATRMVQDVTKEGLDSEELIRLALQSTIRN